MKRNDLLSNVDTPILRVENIHKSYGKLKILKGVNITIKSGDVYLLLGENGSGKSTLLSIISGLIFPQKGKIHKLDGIRIGGYIEYPSFYPGFTGLENLMFLKRLQYSITKEKIYEYADIFKIGDSLGKKCGTYSTGMLKRLVIVQSLLTDSDLLIFDEPTNGLDPFGITQLREAAKLITTRYSKSILITSHVISETKYWANRFGILHNGKIENEFDLINGEVNNIGEATESVECIFLSAVKGNKVK